MEDRFFVIYPKAGYSETEKIIRDITGRLGIDYRLWSYSDVFDEYDYYKKVVEPAIEKAEFVMVFLTKESENEFLVSESVRFCSNLNKSLIPIKLKDSDVKDDAEFDEKKWNIRSKAVDFSDEIQRMGLLEQMYAWLGLVRKGDTYGSKVFISTKSGSIISRNKEILGTADEKGRFLCTLAKGSGNIDIKFGGCWNRYKYNIPDNDSELHFEASLSGAIDLSKIGDDIVFQNIDDIPKWDMTNRDDFVLMSSSEDKKKKEVIYNLFDKYYRSKMKRYSDFSAEKIGFSFFWDINLGLGIVWGIIMIVVGVIFLFDSTRGPGLSILLTGLIMSVLLIILRMIRIRLRRKKIMNIRQKMITEVDTYNEKIRSKANDMMNKELKSRGLPDMYLQPATIGGDGAKKIGANISLESESEEENNAEPEVLNKNKSTILVISFIMWAVISFIIIVIAVKMND